MTLFNLHMYLGLFCLFDFVLEFRSLCTWYEQEAELCYREQVVS